MDHQGTDQHPQVPPARWPSRRPSRQPAGAARLSRRAFFCRGLTAAAAAGLMTGCVPQAQARLLPDLTWGRRGLSEGLLMKPRAMVIDPADNLYIVDMTGRIQVFDIDGQYLRGWSTPIIKQGKPTGLGFSNDGSLIVADTHYFRVLLYTPDGTLQEERTIGGVHGDEPGQFHFVTDVAQDRRGHFLVGQYGQVDRIQEFDPQGQLIRAWGSQGSQPGEFSRPQALLFDNEGLLWIADACNHRIQVFDIQGPQAPALVNMWGQPGSAIGQLQYPYGLDFDQDGTLLVAEFGNHRVQRFSRTGEALESWGKVGKARGQFLNPWALGVDSKRNMHVLDTMNHRVQRFALG